MFSECPICGKEFEVIGPQKYCSIQCRNIAWNQRRCPSKECTCVVCGDKFTPLHTSAKYCSKKCHNKAKSRRKTVHKRICEFCGKEFETLILTQKFCSNKCQNGNQNKKNKDKRRFSGNREVTLNRDDRKCAVCGTKENIIVHHLDESGQTQNKNDDLDNLTVLCRSCHINLYHRKQITKPERYINVLCGYCGKEFQTTQDRIESDRGKFCSKECHNKSMVKHTMIVCEQCGQEFSVTPSRLKRGVVKYCSMDCRKQAGYAWTGKR